MLFCLKIVVTWSHNDATILHPYIISTLFKYIYKYISNITIQITVKKTNCQLLNELNCMCYEKIYNLNLQRFKICCIDNENYRIVKKKVFYITDTKCIKHISLSRISSKS